MRDTYSITLHTTSVDSDGDALSGTISITQNRESATVTYRDVKGNVKEGWEDESTFTVTSPEQLEVIDMLWRGILNIHTYIMPPVPPQEDC